MGRSYAAATALSVVILALAPTPVTAAQDTLELKVAAVVAVMDFRRAWLGDSTPFEGCSAAEATGVDRGLVDALPDHLAPMVVRGRGDNCTVDAPSFDPAGRRLVMVKKIELRDSLGYVTLYVRVGSYTHHEVFRLERRGPPGRLWRVRSIEIKPAIAI